MNRRFVFLVIAACRAPTEPTTVARRTPSPSASASAVDASPQAEPARASTFSTLPARHLTGETVKKTWVDKDVSYVDTLRAGDRALLYPNAHTDLRVLGTNVRIPIHDARQRQGFSRDGEHAFVTYGSGTTATRDGLAIYATKSWIEIGRFEGVTDPAWLDDRTLFFREGRRPMRFDAGTRKSEAIGPEQTSWRCTNAAAALAGGDAVAASCRDGVFTESLWVDLARMQWVVADGNGSTRTERIRVLDLKTASSTTRTETHGSERLSPYVSPSAKVLCIVRSPDPRMSNGGSHSLECGDPVTGTLDAVASATSRQFLPVSFVDDEHLLWNDALFDLDKRTTTPLDLPPDARALALGSREDRVYPSTLIVDLARNKYFSIDASAKPEVEYLFPRGDRVFARTFDPKHMAYDLWEIVLPP